MTASRWVAIQFSLRPSRDLRVLRGFKNFLRKEKTFQREGRQVCAQRPRSDKPFGIAPAFEVEVTLAPETVTLAVPHD
jgi:hypothetical protein